MREKRGLPGLQLGRLHELLSLTRLIAGLVVAALLYYCLSLLGGERLSMLLAFGCGALGLAMPVCIVLYWALGAWSREAEARRRHEMRMLDLDRARPHRILEAPTEVVIIEPRQTITSGEGEHDKSRQNALGTDVQLGR